MNKHPCKYTSQEVYDLSDRLLFAGHGCDDPEVKALLMEAGRVLLNRQATLSQIKVMVNDADPER